MLYKLYLLRDAFGPFNLFQYLTFRTGGAIITAFVVSLLVGPVIINFLKKKHIVQVERVPNSKAHARKLETPTMGGLIILVSLLTSVLLWNRLDSRFVLLLLWTTFLLASVGIYDDFTKLIKKNPAGAPSSFKLTVQLIVAITVVGYLVAYPPNHEFATSLSIPYIKGHHVDFSNLYYAVAMFLIIGASNSVNLTDGMDGLASGSIVFCALTYAIFAYLAGNAIFASYLKIIPVEGAGEISVFMGALMGSCMGFVWFNAYPAKVFMGDTSSLFLGGIIGVTAICVKQELILPIVGGIFVIETLSVMLQMASYKLRNKKRIFRMAPIHHHFQLGGLAEPKIVTRFWILGIMLMLAALASLKIR
jgi:phospho-N-acetylmuramoyl-pentapeptide-transferase